MKVNSIHLMILIATIGIASCRESDDESSTNDYYYNGSIRIYLGQSADPQQVDYRPMFATSRSVARLGVCTLKEVRSSANCLPGRAGYYETDLIAENGDRRYFRSAQLVSFAHNLALVFQGTDARGAVIDTRVELIEASSVGSTVGGSGSGLETRGSGGRTGEYDGVFGQGGRFKMVAPSDNGPSKSHGLLIFLHGSQASSYDRFASDNARVAAANGLMSVSVLAPNGKGWNEGDQNAAAMYLLGLIKDVLFKQYNVDRRKIFFHGQSSGAGFLSSHFVARYGSEFGGGALMLCGASPPETRPNVTEAMKRSFRLYYDITTQDSWNDSLAPAIKAYRDVGLVVESPSETGNQKPGGHCDFDQQAILAEKLPAMIRANGTSGGLGGSSSGLPGGVGAGGGLGGSGGSGGGFDSPQDVTFRIRPGTGSGAWNTEATKVRVYVGKRFTIVNDDSVVHQWHTNGAPCPHGEEIQPGQSVTCSPSAPYSGPALYDHITQGAFHIEAR